MKKEGFLGRMKNTFEKKKSYYRVFVGSPEFQVDPASRPDYLGPIASSDFE
jgi:hypothetical protein